MVNSKRSVAISLCAAVFAIVLTLAAFFMMSGAMSVEAASSSNATVSGYEAQIKDLEQKEAALKKEIENLKNDTAKALKLKKTLDSQLAVTYEKMDAANALVAELEAQISATESDIAKMEENLAKQRKIFIERLRIAHEDNNVSYIAMLFDADGLSDFFNNIERVGALLDYDKKVMDNYTEQKNTLQTTKATLDAQMEKQNEYQLSLKKTESELELQLREADALLERINANQDAYKDDLKEIQKQADALEKELAEYIKKLQEAQNKDYMVEGQLQWPIKTSSTGYNRITSTFGYRDLEVNGNDVSNHKGIDIGVRYVSIYAAGPGTVLTSAYSESYGYYIVIDHGGGISTVYAHLSKLGVKKGQTVKAGQYIADSGNTGWSNGPHLHFELRINGAYKNPLTTKDKYGIFYLARPSNLYYVD